jgi:hypothetical protein
MNASYSFAQAKSFVIEAQRDTGYDGAGTCRVARNLQASALC